MICESRPRCGCGFNRNEIGPIVESGLDVIIALETPHLTAESIRVEPRKPCATLHKAVRNRIAVE